MALKPPWPMTERIVLLGNELRWDASVPSIHVLEQMPPPSHPLSLPREEITLQMSSVALIITPTHRLWPCSPPTFWLEQRWTFVFTGIKGMEAPGPPNRQFPIEALWPQGDMCPPGPCPLVSGNPPTMVPWCKIILETLTASLSKNFFTTLAFGLCSLEKEREKTGK